MSYLFSSESVSEGHPDKVSDQISDALLDSFLKLDPNSKVACETLVTTGLVVLSGEVRTSGYVEVQDVAREVIKNIGYTKQSYRFDYNSCGVISTIHEQSGDIHRGVERGSDEDMGAGDQGIEDDNDAQHNDQHVDVKAEDSRSENSHPQQSQSAHQQPRDNGDPDIELGRQRVETFSDDFGECRGAHLPEKRRGDQPVDQVPCRVGQEDHGDGNSRCIGHTGGAGESPGAERRHEDAAANQPPGAPAATSKIITEIVDEFSECQAGKHHKDEIHADDKIFDSEIISWQNFRIHSVRFLTGGT